MRKLLLLLVLFIVTSCAVTTGAGVTCYRRVCTGDAYIYAHTPRQGSRDVHVIKVTNTYIIIKDDKDGKEYRVPPGQLKKRGYPVKTHYPNRGQG